MSHLYGKQENCVQPSCAGIQYRQPVQWLKHFSIAQSASMFITTFWFKHQYCNRESDEITTEVPPFGTAASELAKFTDWCRNRHPEQILMESTGVLWFSPYEALESVGFTNRQLSLINARDFKAIVGRKSDKQDAERLAYARLGNVRSSFVPAKCFREMRTVSRLLSKTTDEQSRARSRYLRLWITWLPCQFGFSVTFEVKLGF